mmetsp:Transcript_3679/g.7892  ORF Transcript_3679/g.7892 Transcript_3679/m.7892 type:complete len:220 (-) Transcript_3679:459-1118(-)
MSTTLTGVSGDSKATGVASSCGCPSLCRSAQMRTQSPRSTWSPAALTPTLRRSCVCAPGASHSRRRRVLPSHLQRPSAWPSARALASASSSGGSSPVSGDASVLRLRASAASQQQLRTWSVTGSTQSGCAPKSCATSIAQSSPSFSADAPRAAMAASTAAVAGDSAASPASASAAARDFSATRCARDCAPAPRLASSSSRTRGDRWSSWSWPDGAPAPS